MSESESSELEPTLEKISELEEIDVIFTSPNFISRNVTIKVKTNDTILAVKALLCENDDLLDVKPDDFSLVYTGKILSDAISVSSAFSIAIKNDLKPVVSVFFKRQNLEKLQAARALTEDSRQTEPEKVELQEPDPSQNETVLEEIRFVQEEAGTQYHVDVNSQPQEEPSSVNDIYDINLDRGRSLHMVLASDSEDYPMVTSIRNKLYALQMNLVPLDQIKGQKSAEQIFLCRTNNIIPSLRLVSKASESNESQKEIPTVVPQENVEASSSADVNEQSRPQTETPQAQSSSQNAQNHRTENTSHNPYIRWLIDNSMNSSIIFRIFSYICLSFAISFYGTPMGRFLADLLLVVSLRAAEEHYLAPMRVMGERIKSILSILVERTQQFARDNLIWDNNPDALNAEMGSLEFIFNAIAMYIVWIIPHSRLWGSTRSTLLAA